MSNEQKINYYDLIDVIEKKNKPFNRETLIGNANKTLGTGLFIRHDLGNGIATFISNYKLYKDSIVSLSSNISGAVLIFNLGKDILYNFEDNQEYLLKKNKFLVGFSSNDFSVEMKLKKNTYYNTITIGIKEELLLSLTNYFDDLKTKMVEAKENHYSILEGATIDPDQVELLKAFKEKKLDKNLLSELYLESKTTDLIHYTIRKLEKIMQSKSTLDTKKIDSLERAKEIILNEYASSLSIKDIAYKSAINECYLKKDFKNYYGMTIHEMLQKHRMEMAKKLLKEDFSVKEVSQKVGYKHLGHFSKLFSTYFGISPSSYKKQL